MMDEGAGEGAGAKRVLPPRACRSGDIKTDVERAGTRCLSFLKMTGALTRSTKAVLPAVSKWEAPYSSCRRVRVFQS